jgi:hypothetical protein
LIDHRRGFKGLLTECAEGAESWTQVLDCFEGLGRVALMMIHQSKNLEFHTMIFYGLDSETWWSLRPDKIENLLPDFLVGYLPVPGKRTCLFANAHV